MALFEFKFPDVGEGIHEGTIVKWRVRVGDKVEADQVLGEIETDKAVVEIPSPKKGKIMKLHVKEGGIIKVGETMVTIEVSGEPMQKEAIKGIVGEKAGGVVGFLPESEDELIKKGTKQEKKAEASYGGVLATPAVRKLAADLGVVISALKGTGPNGMVTQDDVVQSSKGGGALTLKTEPAQAAQPKVVRKYDMWGYIDHVQLKGIRRATAQHMNEAWKAPHVTLMDEADVTELAAVRDKAKVNAEKKGVKLTYLAYIVRATVEALKKHPMLNAALEGDEIIVKKYFNIGIAVDTGDGLVVPVVKGADKKDLMVLASEIERYAKLAKDRKLDLADMQGGSFTISNVGVIAGTFFTPVLNSPEVGILGVGRMAEKPVVRDGKVVVRKMLPLMVTFDHRVIDGAEAARFMSDLVGMLQNPQSFL